MSEIRIARADGVPLELLRDGMVAAFADYALPMQPSQAAFDFMMRQRGMSAADSLVAFSGDDVIGVWVVSVEGPAGYLISSGTVPEHRGKGVARRMAERSLNDLAARGVATFQTEVLLGNDVARGLYEGLGMEVRRELACLGLPDTVENGGETHDVTPLLWHEVAPEVAQCRDWAPSWQNDDAAMGRCGDDLCCVALKDAKGLAGYAVLIRPTGVLAQIGVRPDRRGAGLARTMVAALAQQQPGQGLRVLNAQASDTGFARFMTRLGAEAIVGQHEMFRRL